MTSSVHGCGCQQCCERADDLDEAIRRLRLLVLDFDGVLTSNDVWVDETGRESVRCWRGDGIGLENLRVAGVRALVLSSESNSVVIERADKLRIRSRTGVRDKLRELNFYLTEEIDELGVGLEHVAYLGNDTPDADCLRAVGLPMVVADAHESVVPLARYVTKARGGYGAVREVCDMIVRARRGKSV